MSQQVRLSQLMTVADVCGKSASVAGLTASMRALTICTKSASGHGTGFISAPNPELIHCPLDWAWRSPRIFAEENGKMVLEDTAAGVKFVAQELWWTERTDCQLFSHESVRKSEPPVAQPPEHMTGVLGTVEGGEAEVTTIKRSPEQFVLCLDVWKRAVGMRFTVLCHRPRLISVLCRWSDLSLTVKGDDGGLVRLEDHRAGTFVVCSSVSAVRRPLPSWRV